MALIVTTDGDNFTIAQGARVTVRNSSGIPYVVVFNDSDKRIEVYKGDGTTPTQFDEQDVNGTGNGPVEANYVGMSAAIDSSDIIHIAYLDLDTAKNDGGLRYVQFDTGDDTFKNDASKLTWGDDPPTAANAHTAIAIDSSGRVHIVFICLDTNMGTPYNTVVYTNDVASAGTFKATVEVEGQANQKQCLFPDITIDADDLPCISYQNETDSDIGTAQGDANDAASFTLFDIDTNLAVGAIGTPGTSIAVDSLGNQHVAFVSNTSSVGDAHIRKHNYGDDWDTEAGGLGWQAVELVSTSFSLTPTLVIDGTDRYIFVEEIGTDDIELYIDTGGGWAIHTTSPIEGGTFNTVKGKWAFWVDNDSGGALLSFPTATYYFDGSDVLADDPDNVWTGETNTDDGDTGTFGHTSTQGDIAPSNEIKIEGTNAPASGNFILKVEARVYGETQSDVDPNFGGEIHLDGGVTQVLDFTGGQDNPLDLPFGSADWTSYVELGVPSGGWTWAKLQGLEVYFYNDTAGSSQIDVYKFEIRVTTYTRSSSTELDYVFTDETGTPDILWNKLDLAAPAPRRVFVTHV